MGGVFDSFNGVPRRSSARLTTNAAVDASFAADLGAFQPVKSRALHPTGKIVVGGRFADVGEALMDRVARGLALWDRSGSGVCHRTPRRLNNTRAATD